MNKRTSIKLPRFARGHLDATKWPNLRCRFCSTSLTEQHVVFVGAARGKRNGIYFSYQASCPRCRRMNTVVDESRSFTDASWWEELGRWHQQALDEMGPFNSNTACPTAAARLLIGPPPLRITYVYWGYKGDAGPVLLFGFGGAFNGYGSPRMCDN